MHAKPGSELWWPFGPPSPEAPLRLLCLPHAGGGASVFGPWRKAAGLRIQVCPIQLPGREARIREAPFRRMSPLLDALVDVLRPRLAPPYALFGYSMGALIAFELTHRLGAAALPLPRVLFLAASAPPHLRNTEHPLHALPDDRFREALRDLNGTPAAVLDHDELMELMLPALRADFELTETYARAPGEPLDTPIVAFGGTSDPGVPVADLEAWGSQTRAGFRAVTLPAGHFFMESHAAELLREVRAELDARDGAGSDVRA